MNFVTRILPPNEQLRLIGGVDTHPGHLPTPPPPPPEGSSLIATKILSDP